MSNESNKSEGVAQQIGGKIKKVVGQVIGDESMEAAGAAKQAEGIAREEAAKANERGKGKIEEVIGAVKNRVGHVIDNERLAAEGKATELKGEDRQASNR